MGYNAKLALIEPLLADVLLRIDTNAEKNQKETNKRSSKEKTIYRYLSYGCNFEMPFKTGKSIVYRTRLDMTGAGEVISFRTLLCISNNTPCQASAVLQNGCVRGWRILGFLMLQPAHYPSVFSELQARSLMSPPHRDLEGIHCNYHRTVISVPAVYLTHILYFIISLHLTSS